MDEFWLVVAVLALAVVLITAITIYMVMTHSFERHTLFSQILLIHETSNGWYIGPLQSLTTAQGGG